MISWIIKYRNFLFWLMLILTVFFAIGISKAKLNFSFEKFFAEGDKDVAFFKEYRQKFPQNDNLIYLAIHSGESTVFDSVYVAKTNKIVKEIESFQYIEKILSFNTLKIPRKTPLGYDLRKVLKTETQEGLTNLRFNISKDSLFIRPFLSKDQTWSSIIILVDTSILDDDRRDFLVQKIESLALETGYKYVLTGVPVIRTQYVGNVKRELILFTAISFLLVLIVLFFIYRSWWGIGIPLIGLFVPLIWILGWMGWMGIEIDLMTTLLPSLMFIVGIADMVHLVTKFVLEVRKGRTRSAALRISLKEMGWAILVTAFAEAIGFASLFTSPILPLRNFGLYAATGIGFAFLITIGVLPAMLDKISTQSLIKTRINTLIDKDWNRFLLKIHNFTFKNKKLIYGLFLVFLVASLIGIAKISTNVYLLDDIGKEDPIRKNMNSYSELFSGIRIFEMSVKPLQGISLQDPELIYQLEKVELYLCREFGISECMWVGKALKIENYVDHFQNIKYHKLPPKELIPQYIANLKSGAPEYYSGFVDEGGNQLRISARIGDLGSDRMARFEKSLEQYIRKTCPDPKFTWKLTGTSKLYEQNNKNLATGLLLGLAGSTLIMALALATLFRSPAMILIALIPNIIPLLFLGGIMGFAGITLKASSSIIFSISFGIALNDTIHFLSRFKLEMAQTKSLDIALRKTLFETGQAMILTTLTLLAGFCLLLFSDFGGTRYIGLFSAITLLLAALCDMFLLPLLISDLTFRSKKRAS